ncbi:MAG TPA: ammonium transporter [Planctomycetaceae bacterium]|nr:ammonium transporter [Planctomycetaceae bacterium]
MARWRLLVFFVGIWMSATVIGQADEAATVAPVAFQAADIAWMLTATTLVLLMTAPGLALFYGGLVRKKNILSVMMQCMTLMSVMSVIWAAYGYSLCFSGDVAGLGLIGDFQHVGLMGVAPYWDGSQQVIPPQVGTGIPKLLHFAFQMMFFIITPALICGAFAERMKFSSMLLFSVLWGTIVYCPVAHWVWSDAGWCSEFNPRAAYRAFDFAGGTVIHITSGFSALVCSVLLGQRLGFRQEPMPPHNLTYTAVGAALLWVGWFGFNAGSAGSASFLAVNALVATHLAASTGGIAWAVAEWIARGTPSVLGACSGAVAGLVCVTPASGSATPFGGAVMGLAAGLACFYACTTLKNKFAYDDTLDAFGVHGVGGLVGAILTGVFATRAVTGKPEAAGLLDGHPQQIVSQAVGAGAAILWAVIATVLILKIVDAILGLRVSQAGELQGLDISQHGEEGYIFH